MDVGVCWGCFQIPKPARQTESTSAWKGSAAARRGARFAGADHECQQAVATATDDTEKRLETQTIQISSYLTEARTDGLTGLLNRRAFDKATDELFAAWSAKKQRFSLGLIDIDHFKQINDTHGHPAGDTV